MSFVQYILEKSFLYVLIIVFCYLFNKIASRYCFKFIKTYIKSKKTPIWFRYSLIKPMLKIAFYTIPSIVVYIGLSYNSSSILYLRILNIVISTYLITILAILFTSFIEFLEAIYSQNKYAVKANISIKTLSQSLKIIMWVCAAILAFGVITDSSVANIFTGIAGISAISAFLFQDIIKNFASFIQIILQDLIRIGDWVEIPEMNSNGIITHISFTSVKIESSNKTIITIPTQKLIAKGLINSRNIVRAGTIAIRQTLTVKMDNFKHLSQEKFDDLLMNPIINCHITQSDYSENITNLTIFRIYAERYLRNNNDICNKSLILVYMAEPSDSIFKIDILAATKLQDLKLARNLESKIVEDLISVLNLFTTAN